MGVGATAGKVEGPRRTCVGCRRVRPKDELVRIVREADGTVTVDARGTRPGRGAYLCGDAACVERGLRRGRLGHAFRAAARVTPELAASIAAVARARSALTGVPVE